MAPANLLLIAEYQAVHSFVGFWRMGLWRIPRGPLEADAWAAAILIDELDARAF